MPPPDGGISGPNENGGTGLAAGAAVPDVPRVWCPQDTQLSKPPRAAQTFRGFGVLETRFETLFGPVGPGSVGGVAGLVAGRLWPAREVGGERLERAGSQTTHPHARAV